MPKKGGSLEGAIFARGGSGEAERALFFKRAVAERALFSQRAVFWQALFSQKALFWQRAV